MKIRHDADCDTHDGKVTVTDRFLSEVLAVGGLDKRQRRRMRRRVAAVLTGKAA